MADWATKYASELRGKEEASRVAAFEEQPGFIGGFVTSAASSFGEMFGMKPSETAEQFRNENPVSGFVSELLPIGGVYGEAYKLSQAPKYAAALERGVARLGINAAERPVLAGTAREMLRYAPVELGRLAVGSALHAVGTEGMTDWGDLFADVGLSTLIAGGFGGIGGYFKAGGKRAADPGHVVGAEWSARPTFELELALKPGAKVTGEGTSVPEVISALTHEVLTERAYENLPKGIKSRYVQRLEGANAEEMSGLESLFKADSSRATDKTLRRQLLTETEEANARTLNPGEQAEVVAALGFQDVSELASKVVFPRVVTVTEPRAAGALAKTLDQPALKSVGNGTLMAKEENGLFVFAKRVRAGAAEADAKTFGSSKVAAGDRWVIGKTARPELFAPDAAKIANTNIAQWARMRDAFVEGARGDVFNAQADMMLRSLSPLDYRDLKHMTRRGWIDKQAQKLGKTIGKETGLEGSATLRHTAEWAYDVFKPTMFLEHQDTLFGRMFGLLRNNMRVADTELSLLMRGAAKFRGTPGQSIRGGVDFVPGPSGFRPVAQVLNDLDREELDLVVKAAITQTPGEDLAKLSASGVISDRAKAAVAELQGINKDMLERIVLPALKSAGMEGKFDFLEGYILPRLWRGDWRQEVLDERGVARWLASGANPAQAQAEAKAVIAEAAARGQSWTAAPAKLAHVAEKSEDDLKAIGEMVSRRLFQSEDDAEIIRSAMKRISLAKHTSGAPLPLPGNPRTLLERKGMPGTPDVTAAEHREVLKNIENHARQLMRFAGYNAWRERWATETFKLSQSNPTLHQNLMRKANQYMGIEGQITNTLNKTLQPVLGGLLGSKPATKIAQATNELMYNFQLALFNPTFALLNLLTPLQTVAPWVAFATRAPKAEVAKIMQFIPTFDNMGRAVGGAGTLDPMKVLGQATRDLKSPTPELKSMLEQATTDGTLAPQLFEEWVGPASKSVVTLRESFKQEGWLGFMKRTATYMSDKSEQYSRMIAFNSGYYVGKHSFGLEGDALYRFAKRATEVTMYNYGVVDRSRVFTGPLGSMVGLFKNWQMHFMGNMINYAGLAVKENVWSPLLWQMGAATALGGLGATPLKVAADGLARYYSDAPNSYLWLQENWQDSADEVYFGLPAFLGVSLQASANIPGTDVRNEASSLFSFVLMERGKRLGAAMGDMWQVGTASGENALRDGNVRDKLLAALAPRALYRAIGSIEGDYVKSMTTGYPQVRELSPAGQMVHALGLNTVEVEHYTVAAKELWRDSEKKKAMIQGLGKAYGEAQQAADMDEMSRLLARATAMQVPISSVIQSSMTRQRREEGDVLSRYGRDAQRYVTALQE